MKKFDILFSILTLPEVEFLSAIAKRLIDKGYKVGFILFHEAGRARLTEMGIPFFNMHELRVGMKSRSLEDYDLEKIRQEYGISNFRYLFIHELLGYNRSKEKELLKKVIDYLEILNKILTENNVKCVIQEMGGFSSNQSVYYATRKNDIDHVFYEPSSFSKRIVFNLNSYYSKMPGAVSDNTIDNGTKKEVEYYLANYLKEMSLVIPFKDEHSFKDMTIRKIINFTNIKKLYRKMSHKYISRQREEYSEIGWVVKYSFIKLIRRMLLNKYYEQAELSAKYIYYPLHVPHDVQLTSRSRPYYFQEGLIEYLCREIPYGYKLYIKEHPASIGGHPYNLLKALLKQYQNLSLIHPETNSFKLIENAELVVTVNSKVGFEAIMQRKKVVVVGDAFYKNNGVTFDLENINEVGRVIDKAIQSEPASVEKVNEFLQKIYKWSYPCELFYMEKENMELSYNSFYEYLKSAKLKELQII